MCGSPGGIPVSAADGFDVVVVGDQSGFPFVQGVNAVLSALFRMIDAGDAPRLVLPNPDLVYPNDVGFGMASGSVALIIEAALRQRYPEARQGLSLSGWGSRTGRFLKRRYRRTGTRDMVMLGDTLETDIRGANAFGIDSVLVAGGVTPADGLEGAVDVPTYWIRGLER